MLIRILNKLFVFLSFQWLRLRWKKYYYSTLAVFDRSSSFSLESNIYNLQGNKSQIQIGKSTTLKGELLLFGHGGKIKIGNACYIGENTRIWSADEILIGDNVLIAHNVNIHDNISHPLDASLRHEHYIGILTKGHPTSNIDLKEKKVIIKNDAWIGFNATILKGVTVGERAIVGACSVVTSDVPNDAIVVGNPARIISYSTQ